MLSDSAVSRVEGIEPKVCDSHNGMLLGVPKLFEDNENLGVECNP